MEYFNNKLKERNSTGKTIWFSLAKKEGILNSWTGVLDDLLSDATGKHLVHLSISLEAIAGLKGVSTNCLSGGISTQDASQMVFEAGLKLGKSNLLASAEISDYNPFVED